MAARRSAPVSFPPVGAGVLTRPSDPFSVFCKCTQYAPAVHRPRCMLHHLGADHLVEAGGLSIGQSGSDNLLTPFKRLPRRPELPAKQCNSPGSGPAGPENYGYFPSLESSPPAGGISPKTKQRFRRCGGEFLSERSERNQRIAGGWDF